MLDDSASDTDIRTWFDMTQAIDAQKIAALLKECAEKYILPRYNTLSADQIQTKAHENDLVTIADIETERALQDILPKMFPGCIVVGEECVSRGEISLDILKDPAQTVFVVDPVDGTYNFRHGKREFAVMMALVINGETQMGWIYDVLGDAHAIVEKGAGAFHDGKRLHVAGHKADAELIGHIRKSYFPKDMQDRMGYLKPACQSIKQSFSLSCAAHEYLRIAQGLADFSIYGWMKPWDHLAGTLLVQEAGGHVAKWDGTPYVPQDDHGGLTIASSPALWAHVHDTFLKPALG
jgi:fructose-1,6-bisphosphatase/inositol monophosphatase family enzyme